MEDRLRDSLLNNVFAQQSQAEQSQTLQNDIETSRKQLAELNAQVGSRTTELNHVAAQFKELVDKLTEVQAQNFAAAEQLTKYKLELENIVKELDDARLTQQATLLEGGQ